MSIKFSSDFITRETAEFHLEDDGRSWLHLQDAGVPQGVKGRVGVVGEGGGVQDQQGGDLRR